MLSKVAERGQVTIPKTLREKLGIHPGAILDFKIEHGALIAKKVITTDPVAKVMGCLKMAQTTDEFIEEIRGPKE
ncbi:MAG: AbrB/MazE/SpoVT family DNA-binding domain-containing protein [Legionellales bacterium]|jgi:AbrB family looped-hinge helix DNA binding protein